MAKTMVIGIAGASGSGKSTVAAHLCRGGGVHIDADAVGHDLLVHDSGVAAAVRDRIGADVFDASGAVDRRRLGAKVFADPALLSELNAILHPAIAERCRELVEVARAALARRVVVDAALLLEVRMPFAFDLVIALRAGEEERFRRIMAKGGWSEAEVRRRMANQRSIEKSFYKADAVVDTDGDEGALLKRIDTLVDGALGAADGEQ